MSSVHAWRDNSSVVVDVFICGEMQPQVAVDIMRQAFRSNKTTVMVVVRGQLHGD
ncbi:MAG: S-adenosylmethionine decarboxylase [Candidatus Binatia bacterium]